jgi:hypothetical protein
LPPAFLVVRFEMEALEYVVDHLVDIIFDEE